MEYILNEISNKTTNSFGINNIKLNLEIEETSFDSFKISNEDNLIIKEEVKDNFGSKIGLPSNKYLYLSIKPKKEINDVIVISYDFNDKKYLASEIRIDLDYNMNTIIIFKGENSFLNFKLNVKTKKNITSNISIINLTKDSNSFISIENIVDDNSNVITNFFDISGKLRVSNYYSDIIGINGISNFNNIYIGKNNDRLDMNYYTKNNNVNTKADMNFEGVLYDNSIKSLKGTVDFIKGCKSSSSKEKENCILLSDNCKSISLPMLLCHEEDVAGEHSVSSGKIDADKLFYLESRGIDEEEAKRLIIMSNFKPILDNIMDEKIKEDIIDIISKEIK